MPLPHRLLSFPYVIAGNANVTNCVESVRREVELLTARGINKIIVIGHTYGWIEEGNEAFEIAENVPDVDIIVLAGANNFLCNGE